MSTMTSAFSRAQVARPLAAGVVVLAVALSGCASSKKSSSPAAATAAGSAVSASPSAPAAAGAAASAVASVAAAVGSGLKGDPAAISLVTSAINGLSTVKSVNVTGTITDSGQTVTFGLQLASGAGATGNLTFQGGTVQLVVLPTAIYLNADQKALAAVKSLGGAAASAETQEFAQYAGKWVELLDLTKLPTSGKNPLDKVNDYSDLSKLSAELKGASGTVTLADKKTIDGQSAQGVAISDGMSSSVASGAIVYFQTGGAHLPLELVPSPPAAGTSADAATGSIDFTDYNKPVSISAPAGAINLSPLVMGLLGGALGGGLGSGAPSSGWLGFSSAPVASPSA